VAASDRAYVEQAVFEEIARDAQERAAREPDGRRLTGAEAMETEAPNAAGRWGGSGARAEIVPEILPETPARLRGDPSRLRQVLVNLVGNALKFTREGEVVVRAMCGSSSRDEHVMRFEVRDSGVGIAPSAQASLFQPFSQADSSTTRRYGGTGLGLAICRRLTTLMGGEIEVESELGRGSTFRFTVRLRPPQEAPPASPHGAALAGRRILVVDGSEATRALITELAGHCGAVVDGDASAREAVARLRGPLDARYDVVLLDAGLSAPERAEVVAAATGPAGAPASSAHTPERYGLWAPLRRAELCVVALSGKSNAADAFRIAKGNSNGFEANCCHK
jgi:CheY-like chemotaxis protein